MINVRMGVYFVIDYYRVWEIMTLNTNGNAKFEENLSCPVLLKLLTKNSHGKEKVLLLLLKVLLHASEL